MFEILSRFTVKISLYHIPPTIILSRKCSLLFTSAAYIQVCFRLDFFKEANNTNPYQTAPEGAGSILFAIQAFEPKDISRQEEQMTKVVTDRLRLI